MRSKLTLAVLLLATAARAETPDELLKRGLALYKDGKYAEAVVVLKQAYDADPKPEVLFPLAQAERLAGNCTAAAEHYKKILEQIGDINTAKLVRQSLELCEPPTPTPGPAPKCEPTTKAPESGPPKTVVREVGHTDRVAVIAAGGGALALGAAVGLYFAASSTRDAADRAGSLASHDTLADRADSERNAMIVTASIGAAALGFATFRFLTHTDARRTDVAVVPTSRGGAVWLTRSW